MEKAVARRFVSQALIKSKQRVADHGEVFTPSWLVEDMLDLTEESDRIDARFLEPACGSGNFLTRILQRKLLAVDLKYKKSRADRRHFSLVAVMSIYGIELLKDNITECRKHMLEIFANHLQIEKSDTIFRAASYVLSQNIVQGDAIKMRTSDNRPIAFAEWEYLGKGKFQRRDFRMDMLAQPSEFSLQQDEPKKPSPTKVHAPMTVSEIASAAAWGVTQRRTV